MNILHVIPSLGKGGAERICLDIVRETRKRGHTVTLAVLDPLNMYKKEYPDIDPIVINSQVSLSILRKWTVEMTDWEKLISNTRPDVIHSHLFKSEVISRYNIQKGTKYFTHCHDNMHQFENLSWRTVFSKRKLTEFYEKRYLINRYNKCNNRFIAISSDTKSYFTKSLPPLLSSRLILLHNAINFDSFNTANLNRSSSPIRLISIGSFVPKKNQRFLVEVARRIFNAGCDVKLTLLGDGPERPSVLDMISRYGLSEIIEAPGNVDNVSNYLAGSNFYVHGALYEPFGLVLIEAMAAGLPVLSINGGGNKDLILEGKNGHLFEAGQVEEFSEKLIYLSQRPDLYRKMSHEAIDFSKNYDIKQYIDKLLLLYSD